MRILVTGGAGFIGSAVIRNLLNSSQQIKTNDCVQVIALDSLTRTGSWAALAELDSHPWLRFVTADIRDAAALQLACRNIDAVVHCAAETSVDASFNRSPDFADTNVAGTESVLSAALAAGAQTFLHFSTDEVYGERLEGSSTEDHPFAPTNPYSLSKAAAEGIIVSAANQNAQVRFVVVRPSNNYGPWQFPDNLIPKFVTLLAQGTQVPLYGDGEHRRCWMHVDDTADAVRLLLHNPSAQGAYNLAGEEMSNRMVVDELLRQTGMDWSYVDHVTGRATHDRRYCNDESKIMRLGYVRRRVFVEEIGQVVEHYRRRAQSQETLLMC
ncbi:MAG: NAD-dependent epimerase/dehydratase family protein [Actinomycetales bacterium]|nr:NAD-dependent epimerase/dehydratase family protein [Actinomycetales bacterium]